LPEECRKNQQQKPRGEKRLVSAVEIYKGKVWAIDKNCSSIEAKNRKTKKFKKFEKKTCIIQKSVLYYTGTKQMAPWSSG
jgi:hypothetical protein